MASVDSGIKNGDPNATTIQGTVVVLIAAIPDLVSASSEREMTHGLGVTVQRNVRYIRSQRESDHVLHLHGGDAHSKIVKFAYIGGAQQLNHIVE